MTSEDNQKLPDSYMVGDNLNWDADWEEVTLVVELPFWLMVPDCTVSVDVEGCEFAVSVTEDFCHLHVGQVTDSLQLCVFHGPSIQSAEIQQKTLASGTPMLMRKCKTVLRIPSRCNTDVLTAASGNSDGRRNSAQLYITSLCGAHIAVVNRLLRAYLLQTYDPSVHEVSPWDVPTWFVRKGDGNAIRNTLLPSADWDEKPKIISLASKLGDKRDKGTEFQYATAEDLTEGLRLAETPGEFELIHSIHLRERGDYSGAVRRSVTAIEVLLQAILRSELLKQHTPEDVQRKLDASNNDFPGQLRQYQKLSGRTLSEILSKELENARNLRHSIVHRGKSLTYVERTQANRSVDFARFVFNWMENDETTQVRRHKQIAQKSVGLHQNLFPAEVTQTGVVVYQLR